VEIDLYFPEGAVVVNLRLGSKDSTTLRHLLLETRMEGISGAARVREDPSHVNRKSAANSIGRL
jgi:hypothetical protein